MKQKIKKEFYYIFNFLYLIWVFCWLYITLYDAIHFKFEVVNVINTVFLLYGFHYFWKHK